MKKPNPTTALHTGDSRTHIRWNMHPIHGGKVVYPFSPRLLLVNLITHREGGLKTLIYHKEKKKRGGEVLRRFPSPSPKSCSFPLRIPTSLVFPLTHSHLLLYKKNLRLLTLFLCTLLLPVLSHLHSRIGVSSMSGTWQQWCYRHGSKRNKKRRKVEVIYDFTP